MYLSYRLWTMRTRLFQKNEIIPSNNNSKYLMTCLSEFIITLCYL